MFKSILSGLSIVVLLSACYSASVYTPSFSNRPDLELNLVFTSKGFKGITGWVWQLGTVVYECNKRFKCKYYGWPEEVDKFEEWDYILGNTSRPRATPNK